MTSVITVVDDEVDDAADQPSPPLGEHGAVGQHVAAGRGPALLVGVVAGGRHPPALPLARALLPLRRPGCAQAPGLPARPGITPGVARPIVDASAVGERRVVVCEVHTTPSK